MGGGLAPGTKSSTEPPELGTAAEGKGFGGWQGVLCPTSRVDIEHGRSFSTGRIPKGQLTLLSPGSRENPTKPGVAKGEAGHGFN